jgi:hypothetical protein
MDREKYEPENEFARASGGARASLVRRGGGVGYGTLPRPPRSADGLAGQLVEDPRGRVCRAASRSKLEREVKVDIVSSGELQGRAGVVPCLLQPLEPPPEDGLVLELVDLILMSSTVVPVTAAQSDS